MAGGYNPLLEHLVDHLEVGSGHSPLLEHLVRHLELGKTLYWGILMVILIFDVPDGHNPLLGHSIGHLGVEHSPLL